jgi:hypothetical protein
MFGGQLETLTLLGPPGRPKPPVAFDEGFEPELLRFESAPAVRDPPFIWATDKWKRRV